MWKLTGSYLTAWQLTCSNTLFVTMLLLYVHKFGSGKAGTLNTYTVMKSGVKNVVSIGKNLFHLMHSTKLNLFLLCLARGGKGPNILN